MSFIVTLFGLSVPTERRKSDGETWQKQNEKIFQLKCVSTATTQKERVKKFVFFLLSRLQCKKNVLLDTIFFSFLLLRPFDQRQS